MFLVGAQTGNVCPWCHNPGPERAAGHPCPPRTRGVRGAHPCRTRMRSTRAGERRLTAVLREAGFTHVRRAAGTPFSIILEARP